MTLSGEAIDLGDPTDVVYYTEENGGGYRTRTQRYNGFPVSRWDCRAGCLGGRGWHPPLVLPESSYPPLKPEVKRVAWINSLCTVDLRWLRRTYGRDLVDTASNCYFRSEKFCLNGEIISEIQTYVLEWSDGRSIEARVGRLRCLRRVAESGEPFRSPLYDGLRGLSEFNSMFHR